MLQDKNILNWNSDTYNLYWQLPVSIELWNSSLKPINNAIVNINVYSIKNYQKNLLYNATKKTDINGKVKFGYSLPYKYYNTRDYYIKIEATAGTKKAWYQRWFQVLWDIPSVTLYTKPEFGGISKTFTADTPYVGDDINDLTSSLKVSPGYYVILYEHSYGGRSIKLGEDNEDLLWYGFDNVVSSLKIRKI